MIKKPNVLTYKLSFGKDCQREGFPFCTVKVQKPVVKISFKWCSLQQKCKAMENTYVSSFLYNRIHHKADNLHFSCSSKHNLMKLQLKWFWNKLQRTIKIQLITNISPPKKAPKFSVILYHPKETMYFQHFFTCFYKNNR